jgi:hypothetical protein
MKEIYFINNRNLFDQCEFLSIKEGKNVGEIMYEIILNYFINKNPDRKIKSSRSLYLLSLEESKTLNTTVPQFLEGLIQSHMDNSPLKLETLSEIKTSDKKKSFFDLNS